MPHDIPSIYGPWSQVVGVHRKTLLAYNAANASQFAQGNKPRNPAIAMHVLAVECQSILGERPPLVRKNMHLGLSEHRGGWKKFCSILDG